VVCEAGTTSFEESAASYPEEGCSRLHENTSTYLPDYIVLYPTKLYEMP
jgi:hypothetical protein